MTRETKIGLLVGLAFIILIGILLSDHLAVSNDPTQAPLAGVNQSVQQGVGSPVPTQYVSNVPVVPDGATGAPRQPVTTQNELAPAPQPQVVQVYGTQQPAGNNGQSILLVNPGPGSGSSNVQVGPAQPIASVPSTDLNRVPVTFVPVNPGDQVPENLQHAVTFGDDTNVNLPGSVTPGNVPNPIDPTPVAALPAGTKQHVVKSGDSLSKIAAAYYGRGDKANIQRIIAANPALKKNPDMIVVGQTYIIPPAPGAAAPQSQVVQTPAPAPTTPAITPISPRDTVTVPTTVTQTPRAQQAADRHEASETIYYYTVKESDTLWKIAQVQLGDGAMSKSIRDLNKDVLNGSDVIRVGQKLRLPARPLADAR